MRNTSPERARSSGAGRPMGRGASRVGDAVLRSEMLAELRVENLGSLKDAHLELSSGLNVISGETGAGKTLCVEALSYLCGARATRDSIGPWDSSATVEARFLLSGTRVSMIAEGGSEGAVTDGIDDSDSGVELVVRRVLDRSGRSRQYLNGRMATVAEIEAAVGGVVQIYGQFSVLRLGEPRKQLGLLDGFCANNLGEILGRYTVAYREAKEIDRRLGELENAGGVAREIDFLRYQIGEITAAKLDPGEDDTLAVEVRRLESADELLRGAEEACEALDSAEDLVWTTASAGPETGSDPAIDALRERARAVASEIQELRREFRAYVDSIDTDEARLAEARERLDLIGSLKKKYGSTIDEILSFRTKAERRLSELEGAEALAADLSQRRSDLSATLKGLAEEPSRIRRSGAKEFERSVGSLLGRLGMRGATFGVEVEAEEPSWPGTCGPAGADAVTFYFSSTQGMAPRPLHKIASGGELARLMLAIEVATSGDQRTPTLVFDEVDQGIGGAAARAVGELLSSVSEARQVLCVTHLAQVASFADVHFCVEKGPDGGTVKKLDEKERVREISRMLGGVADSKAANRHAREILNRAAGRKAS